MATPDLRVFLGGYPADVYGARNPDAARDYVADPCLRHEHGHLVTMSLENNVARIRSFLERFSDATFHNTVVVTDDSHVVSCFNMTMGGETMSGIEVFRIVGGKITETWNSTVQPGAWG